MARKPQTDVMSGLDKIAEAMTSDTPTTMRDTAAEALANAAAPTQIALRPEQAAGFVMVGDDEIQVVRRVTIPIMALKVDPDAGDDPAKLPEKLSIFGKIIEPIYEGRAMQNARFPQPAKLMTLESRDGGQVRIVVNHVLRKELDEAYPENGYVGRWFKLTKFRKKPTKQYNTFEIVECAGPRQSVAAGASPETPPIAA